MKSLKFFLSLAALFLFAGASHAQYDFSSKKAEKLYYNLEDYYAAADYQSILDNEEMITEYYLDKNDTLSALMYSFLGESYLMWEDDLATSLDFYEKELEIRKKLQTKNEYKDLIFNLASLYTELGQYGKSEELYKDLLKADQEEFGKKSEQYVNTGLALLDYYILTSQTEKGLDLADELDRLVKRNSFNDALLKKGYAEFYTLSGEFKKAEKSIISALKTLEESGYYPSLEYVYFLNSMGIMYNDMGQLNVVEEIYREALSILDRLQGNYEEDAITIKSNLALLYLNLGNHDEAENLFKEVQAFDKDYFGEESYSYGISQYNLGLNAYEANKFYDAVQYLEDALTILEMAGGDGDLFYARAANTLASTYSQLEEVESAKKMTSKALAAYSKAVSEDNPEYAFALSNAGLVYTSINELETAEKYRKAELKLREKALGKNHPLYGFTLRRMATLKWQQEEAEEALDYYLEAFDNYFTQINAFFPVLSEDEKSSFYYNSLKPTFEAFNSFVIENKSDDKELLEIMYNYQLATKGLILYATNKVRESILNSGDSIMISKYETWISQKERLAKLFSASDMKPEMRTRKIDSLSDASNELEAELSKMSTAFADNFANKKVTWEDVQEKLKPGEAAVEIIRFRDFDPRNAGSFTDEVYYAALIITSDSENPELVVMRNGKQMETRFLSNYRNAIRYQVNENYSYRLFWRPISNKLGPEIKKIYFSPDGVYNQISIYTLQNPASKNFTIDEFEIQLLTNTKDLVASNVDRKTEFGDQPSYLFGYPNYNMGRVDDEGKEPSTATEEGEGENRGTRGGVRGARGARGGSADDIQELTRGGIPSGLRGNMLRYMRSNSLLALLPGTKKEVNLIDSLHTQKQMQTRTFMAEEAVEDKIKQIKNPKTLHIATHGFFLELDPSDEFGETDKHVENPLLRSGLILAGANSFIRYGEIGAEQELAEDGILTAYEAMNLNLDETELVILSACETGLGEVKNGEGVYGLQRAFQVAGADAIIMSMWTVDDNATQELMTMFYEEWLTSGDKQQAFVRAQKRLKDKWKKPFYWGAFVMVGN